MKMSLHLLCVISLILIQFQAAETGVYQSPFWLIVKPNTWEKEPIVDKVEDTVDLKAEKSAESTDGFHCLDLKDFVKFFLCRLREKEAMQKAAYGNRG